LREHGDGSLLARLRGAEVAENPHMADAQNSEPELQLEEVSLQLPELKPGMQRRLKSCFDHGKRLTSRDRPDYDYANTMFSECVIKDPANYQYLLAFFDNLCRKYNNNKKGARIKVYGSSKGAFKKALAKKDWPEVLRIGPELLKVNPWDTPTLRAMAQACEKYHPKLNEAELKYLKMALDGSPRDIETNKHCARSLARMGQYDQAIACWRRVDEMKKNDPEAQKAMAKLMMDKTRPQVGIDEDDLSEEEKAKRRRERAEAAAAAAEKAREEKERKLAEKKAQEEQKDERRKSIQLTPRQQLEQAIRDNPVDMDNYLELADLHAKEGRPQEVKNVLQRAITAAANDVALQSTIVAYEVRDVRRKAMAAEKRARQEKTAEAVGLAKKLAVELNQRELDLYTDRSARFPDEAELKYEVAVRLKRVGRYEEAIQYFTGVENHERLKARALLRKGESQLQLKLFQQALETFKTAVDQAKAAQDVEYRKQAMWRAARLSEGLKQIVAAEKYYQMLYEFDPNFEDVRARLDKIRKIRDNMGLRG
jgi:tetratricopeptide (TPR) repeat protein